MPRRKWTASAGADGSAPSKWHRITRKEDPQGAGPRRHVVVSGMDVLWAFSHV
ncbi:hypothetical protein HPP92_007208 [Vanilla planifolia]|uniref:Uncharacterized protein n=1 Tax=Vanilla planifolia TaxID=51239 RepID=A0A835VB18_VANPL|nr:hypothetical protein HPP92_007208 [Vanilla planifolia]